MMTLPSSYTTVCSAIMREMKNPGTDLHKLRISGMSANRHNVCGTRDKDHLLRQMIFHIHTRGGMVGRSLCKQMSGESNQHEVSGLGEVVTSGLVCGNGECLSRAEEETNLMSTDKELAKVC